MEDIYIVSAKRTAIGGFLGTLSDYSATMLGAMVIKEAYESIDLAPELVSSVYMGNVLSANLGQSPARQASIYGGIHENVDCTTVNKVCAAGMKAIMLGAQQIQLGLDSLVMTGGMESMSNAPHYAYMRKQTKLSNAELVDGLLKDGLTDVYSHQHMGKIAELSVKKYGLTRSEQDEYAILSYSKAELATKQKKFFEEIVSISIQRKNGLYVFNEDEDISKLQSDKVPLLHPSFETNGTITAANASNLNDGAVAILLASEKAMVEHGLKPMARIVAYADAALHPDDYAIAPSKAIPIALKRAGITIDQIDFIELNEAYAAVVLANQKLLGFDINKTNVYGGAIALGHPLGASGARIVCTLLSVLKQEKGKFGLAAICNGGGGASAMVIENLSN